MGNYFFSFMSRALYKSYVLFRKEATHTKRILNIFITLLALFFLTKIKTEQMMFNQGVQIMIIVYAVYQFLPIFLGFVLEITVINTGGDCVFTNKSLLTFTQKKTCLITSTKAVEDNFSFATLAEMHTINDLNISAFKRSPWGSDPEKKKSRNLSHWTKNQNCFLSIKPQKDNNSVIAFTHIIPVNHYTWNKYKEGHIADNDFFDISVVPKKVEALDDIPFGLIVFTAAISGRHPDYSVGTSYKRFVGDQLSRAILFHIEEGFLKKEYKHHRIVPVMLQSMNPGVFRLLKKVNTIGLSFSKDQARLISFEIENVHVTPFVPLQQQF